jgi:hypothetical protein
MQIDQLPYSLLKCNCTATTFWYDLLRSFGGGGGGEGGAFFLELGLTRPMIYRKDIRPLPLLSFMSALTILLPWGGGFSYTSCHLKQRQLLIRSITECQASRPNWLPPPPNPAKRVLPPPPHFGSGKAHSLRGEGAGSQFVRRDRHSGTLGIV